MSYVITSRKTLRFVGLATYTLALAASAAGCLFGTTQQTRTPKPMTMTVDVPAFVVEEQGQETQEISGVVIQMTPPVFEVQRELDVQCTEQSSLIVRNNQYDYEIEETPRYSISLDDLVFRVTITNRTGRNLPLRGTLAGLNVANRDVAIAREAVDTIAGYRLQPGKSQVFEVRPEIPPQFNVGDNITFSMTGVPTETAPGDVVVSDANFAWTFRYAVDSVQKTDQGFFGVETMTRADAARRCSNR